MDPQQVTMLEDLQQKVTFICKVEDAVILMCSLQMGDICEVEALIEVLCQRLV